MSEYLVLHRSHADKHWEVSARFILHNNVSQVSISKAFHARPIDPLNRFNSVFVGCIGFIWCGLEVVGHDGSLSLCMYYSP